MAAILRRYYGPRSETFDPRQLLLFGQQVEQMPLDEASIADEAGEPLVTRRVKRRDQHGRQQLPEHLERIEIEHDLTPDEKACPACGSERCRIGAEVSEQLEYFPASFKVLKHIRHKYACGKCNADGYNPNIVAAAKPPQPIDKGLPGPSLLAYVITSKLGDHLPLYRLETIFARQQVHVARSTMCAWMMAAGQLVKPLVELMAARVKQSRVIHTDDTPVPIQSPGAKQCRKGRIWCYLGDAAHPYTVYDYTPSRGRDGPARWLAGYSRLLASRRLRRLRRHLCGRSGDGSRLLGPRAPQVLRRSGFRRPARRRDAGARRAELYAVEDQAAKRRIAELTDESGDAGGRYPPTPAAGIQRAGVLASQDQSRGWTKTEGEARLAARSPLGQAITYALNQWTALNAYMTQGFLNIDNNASERALKRVAIGRKNWLFAGHDAAAENHARHLDHPDRQRRRTARRRPTTPTSTSVLAPHRGKRQR